MHTTLVSSLVLNRRIKVQTITIIGRTHLDVVIILLPDCVLIEQIENFDTSPKLGQVDLSIGGSEKNFGTGLIVHDEKFQSLVERQIICAAVCNFVNTRAYGELLQIPTNRSREFKLDRPVLAFLYLEATVFGAPTAFTAGIR